MNAEIIGVILMFLIVMVLAIPLGRYIGKIINYEPTWLDWLFDPLDKLFFKLAGIDPSREMNWKQHLAALLTINVVWFIISIVGTDQYGCHLILTKIHL
jgi:K+-transporting ATPase ATPase A chain